MVYVPRAAAAAGCSCTARGSAWAAAHKRRKRRLGNGAVAACRRARAPFSRHLNSQLDALNAHKTLRSALAHARTVIGRTIAKTDAVLAGAARALEQGQTLLRLVESLHAGAAQASQKVEAAVVSAEGAWEVRVKGP